jgi:starch-binding outer membrane protein, SusD/RagB family
MKNKIIKIIVLAVSAMTLIIGCSEDNLLNKFPKDEVVQNVFMQGETTARQAAIGCFQPLKHWEESYSSRFLHALEVGTDNEDNRPTGQIWRIQMDEWTFDATHFGNSIGMTFWWGMFYQTINNANYAIEYIPTARDPKFTKENQDKYIAIARLMRAFSYMNLSIFWGSVPLHDKYAADIDNMVMARSPRSKVMELVINDLIEAKNKLPDVWTGENSGLPAKAAAAGLLARAYLWAADFQLLDGESTPFNATEYFQKAEIATDDAILIADLTGYSLMPDFLHMMSINSQQGHGNDNSEFIFTLNFLENSLTMPDDGSGNPNMGICERASQENKGIVVYGTGRGAIFPTRDLYDAFEPGDPRRSYSVWAPGDFYGIYHGTTVTYALSAELGGGTKTVNDGDSVFLDYNWSVTTNLLIRKIWAPVKDLAQQRESGYDLPLLRYAELLLMSAEAKIENNKIAEGMAQLNKVRARPSVNMPPLTASDQSDAREKLRHERRIELCLEGMRYYDLLRWDIVEKVMTHPIKARFGYNNLKTVHCQFPKNKLWPIPQAEMDRNPLMTQNPGY